MSQQDGSGGSGVLGRLRGRQGPATTEPHAGDAIDPVTGLPDRAHLLEVLADAVARSEQDSGVAALAFVEIAQLGDVNDSFGHDSGDDLLRSAAERLGTVDLPGTVVMRFPGASFAVVFERIPGPGQVEEIGRFLIELMAEPMPFRGETLALPVHVGLAVSADQYEQLDELVHDARDALVRAREHGGNTFVVHDETRRARFTTKIDERRLADALANGEFLLLYQPIVRLDRREIIGAEALLRWAAGSATNVGLLSPRDFLPLLEKTGLIVPVGRWVVEEACRQTAAWSHRFETQRRPIVTCNLSGRQLADPSFTAAVLDAVDRHDLEPWQLCLDITDDTLGYHREATWSALRGLKDAGVKLALDDFGQGEASLARLRELRLDILRLDRMFVIGIEHNAEDRAIVRHTAALAHELDCLALAEGVENEAQAERLAEAGVDLGQGFHFGRPESAETFTERLAAAHDAAPPEPPAPPTPF